MKVDIYEAKQEILTLAQKAALESQGPSTFSEHGLAGNFTVFRELSDPFHIRSHFAFALGSASVVATISNLSKLISTFVGCLS